MATTVQSNAALPCRPSTVRNALRSNPRSTPTVRVDAAMKATILSSSSFIRGARTITVPKWNISPPAAPVAMRTIKATISVGEKLPEATLSYLDKDDELRTIKVSELTGCKKVVIVAVPGAFTPTCSQKHLPGFVEKAEELKGKGVDSVVCIAVNDAFVMKAWGKDMKVGNKVFLLADGNLEFTKALGVELDLSDKPAGLAIRSRRYALYAEDGVVKVLNLEEGGAFTLSSADDILKAL